MPTKFYRVRDKDIRRPFTEGFYNPEIHDLVDEDATDEYGNPLPPEPDPVVVAAVEVDVLRGQALADALYEAGLSTSGTADEKRQRLAEHNATTEV